MIFTARQLEDLHKSNGHVVLPYGARLTPLAADWARGKKIQIGYGPDELVKQSNGSKPASGIAVDDGAKPQAAGAFLWWCDGPCGAAKAAVGAQSKESSLAAIDLPGESKQLIPAIKKLAAAVKEQKSTGGILLVQSAAAAVVLANRCPSLRAVVGTTLESLEAAISQIAANVLVLEYPNKSFSQLKNLLSRFVRAKRDLSDEMKKQIQELGTCG
jgi:ribose 5-phosphate isomerase RpiB